MDSAWLERAEVHLADTFTPIITLITIPLIIIVFRWWLIWHRAAICQRHMLVCCLLPNHSPPAVLSAYPVYQFILRREAKNHECDRCT